MQAKFEPAFFSLNKKDKYHLPIFIYHLDLNNNAIEANWHEFFEFVIVTQGNGEVMNNSDIISVNANDFQIITPYTIHQISTNGILKGFSIGIDTYFCNFNGIDIQNYNFVPKFTDKVLMNKVIKLSNIVFNKSDQEFIYADICNAALDFIIYMVKHHSVKKEERIKESPIQFAIGYIQSHVNEKLTVDDIAMQAGLSKYYFSRMFKKTTGYTVVDFINLSRCIKARNLLDTKNYTVSDVFKMLPFEDYTYFINLFKKYIGVSPSKYRKNVLDETELIEKAIFKAFTNP